MHVCAYARAYVREQKHRQKPKAEVEWSPRAILNRKGSPSRRKQSHTRLAISSGKSFENSVNHQSVKKRSALNPMLSKWHARSAHSCPSSTSKTRHLSRMLSSLIRKKSGKKPEVTRLPRHTNASAGAIKTINIAPTAMQQSVVSRYQSVVSRYHNVSESQERLCWSHEDRAHRLHSDTNAGESSQGKSV